MFRKVTLMAPILLAEFPIMHSVLERSAAGYLKKSQALLLGLLLQVLPLRNGRAESHLDFKTLYYIEDSDRMLIVSPILLYEHAPDPDLTIKIDAVYNSISGATPTGAPLPPLSPFAGEDDAWTISGASPGTAGGSLSGASPGTSGDGNEDDDEEDDEEDEAEHERDRQALRRRPFHFSRISGASPNDRMNAVRQLPMSKVSDTRTGLNLDVGRRVGRHNFGGQLSFSTESDYESAGFTLRDGIDFNQRSTTLLLGAGLTHDIVKASTMPGPADKDTIDLMIGLVQALNQKTTLTVNLTLALIDGYLDDPYKVVELNGLLVPEHRPETKEKRTAYLSLTRYMERLNGSLETSYRLYNDSFGIVAHTLSLAWHQRLGGLFVLRPLIRIYTQNEADFYGVSFKGDPAHYSSDYRVSALASLDYGLKLVFTPSRRFSADLAVERYDQFGLDGLTPDAAYPAATVVTGGMRVWF